MLVDPLHLVAGASSCAVIDLPAHHQFLSRTIGRKEMAKHSNRSRCSIYRRRYTQVVRIMCHKFVYRSPSSSILFRYRVPSSPTNLTHARYLHADARSRCRSFISGAFAAFLAGYEKLGSSWWPLQFLRWSIVKAKALFSPQCSVSAPIDIIIAILITCCCANLKDLESQHFRQYIFSGDELKVRTT